MTEKKWELFFELLGSIIDMPFETWQEKRDIVLQKADDSAFRSNITEFASWFDSGE